MLGTSSALLEPSFSAIILVSVLPIPKSKKLKYPITTQAKLRIPNFSSPNPLIN